MPEQAFANVEDSETKQAHMVLVYPDFTEDETTRQELGNYSEGLASISAVLKRGGHRVSLMHYTYMPEEEAFKQRLRELKPDVLGFSIRTTAFPFVKTMVKWAKEAVDTLTVGGSYHAILVPDEVLAAEGMDAVAVGEGEAPLLQLCDGIAQRGEIDYSIPSMWYKKPDGEIIKNPVAPLIEDLDSLPFPDHELFDFDNLSASRMKTALVMVSRGCIFRCTYCGNSQFRNIYPNRGRYARFRSPDKAIELIKNLLEKYPYIEFLNFRDAILNMFPKWFEKFIVRYRDEIGLPFTCNLRFDILTEEHVRLLKEAGCYLIDVGVESGDEEIRSKYLERNMTNQNMIDACKWFRKYGVLTLTYNIVGLPYETLERALKTVKLNARLESDRKIPNIFYPYPMTKLEAIAREGGFFDGNYNKKSRVLLEQPQFPERDVMYIYRSFAHLVAKYRKIYALPEEKAKKKEERLDKLITASWYPRGAIAAMRGFYDKCYRAARRTALRRLPRIYMWLRKKKNRLNTAKA